MFNRFATSSLAVLGLATSTLLLHTPSARAQAAPVDEKAFADAVVSYERGTSNNWDAFFKNANSDEEWQVYDPNSALGRNNWTSEMTSSGSLGQWNKDIGVSLGKSGSLTLEFTDNFLTGSGDESSDLWIYEIGGVAEKSFVEISMDGLSWFDVGLADRKDRGNDSGVGIDIDGLLSDHEELSYDSLFSFVRVTDAGTNNYKNFKAGVDIDAIAALSFVEKDDTPIEVPEPGLVAGLVLLGAGFLRQRRA
ncbi:MAG: hypothetical protein AAFV85_10120 [Cyanobacteria bacterium J06634_6]